MDATLVWTAVGSAAAVAGVAAALGVAVTQMRSARKHPPLAADVPVQVSLLPPTVDTSGSGMTVLRAPGGNLPEHVRGRDELLARLMALAEVPDGRVHVLTGIGGGGKSTVALRVAEQMSRLGKPAWWVHAVNAETVTVKLLGLARDAGAQAGEVAAALAGRLDPADLLWRLLQPRTGWLLVFDNADDLNALTVGSNKADSGAGWLRSSASGLIIVTSRDGNPQSWGRYAELHTVGWLDTTSGAQVLTDLAPHGGSLDDASTLSLRLGGLPLALHQAGSQMASQFAVTRTFTEYVHALDERFGRLMSHAAGSDREIVTRTWELSLDDLEAQGRPQGRPILRVLSCFEPGVVITAAMLQPAFLGQVCAQGEDGAADGLDALASVGLITTIPDPAGNRPGVMIHPLVAETSRLLLDSEERMRIGRVAVALLNSAASGLLPDRPADWGLWLQLVPHMNAVYSSAARGLAETDLSALANVTVSAAQALLWHGAYSASLELTKSALHQADRLGGDHPTVLAVRLQLAKTHRSSSNYAEAEQIYRDLLVTQLRVLGSDDPRTLDTRHQIAETLGERGHYEEAEQEYRSLAPEMQRILGADHPRTLDTRHQVAWLLAARGHHTDAELEYRGLLQDKLRILGADHPSTLANRHEIARMLGELSQYQEAVREYRSLMRDKLRILGPRHPSTLVTRYEIARMLTEQGQHQEALQEFRSVLADQIQVLGEDHHWTLDTRYQYARTLVALGAYENAEQELGRVAADQIRVLGHDHPSTVVSRQALTALQMRN
jgi:tetratricopeptide (TPR) repeat protein